MSIVKTGKTQLIFGSTKYIYIYIYIYEYEYKNTFSLFLHVRQSNWGLQNIFYRAPKMKKQTHGILIEETEKTW